MATKTKRRGIPYQTTLFGPCNFPIDVLTNTTAFADVRMLLNAWIVHIVRVGQAPRRSMGAISIERQIGVVRYIVQRRVVLLSVVGLLANVCCCFPCA